MNLADATETVHAFLGLLEARRLGEAERLLAAPVTIIFPGGQQYADLQQLAAAAQGRYRSIKKRIVRSEGYWQEQTAVIFVSGTLYGVNRHGCPFEDVRFIDRFELVDNRITRQEVWNDLAESGALERQP